MAKGCLKHSAFTAVQAPVVPTTTRRCCKTVSFCEDSDVKVHPADDWDRSPCSVTGRLTNEDILELEEILSSIARANRQARRMNYPNLLSNVPVGLMPLLPETGSSKLIPPSSSSLQQSSSSSQSHIDPSCFKPGRPSDYHPPTPPLTPPGSTPSPLPGPSNRLAKRFSFVPLVDTTSISPPSSPAPSSSSTYTSYSTTSSGYGYSNLAGMNPFQRKHPHDSLPPSPPDDCLCSSRNVDPTNEYFPMNFGDDGDCDSTSYSDHMVATPQRRLPVRRSALGLVPCTMALQRGAKLSSPRPAYPPSPPCEDS